MVWEAPEVLHPLVSGSYEMQLNIGFDGELVETAVAEERGYSVEKHNTTVQISIPYNADGGYRKVIRHCHVVYAVGINCLHFKGMKLCSLTHPPLLFH